MDDISNGAMITFEKDFLSANLGENSVQKTKKKMATDKKIRNRDENELSLVLLFHYYLSEFKTKIENREIVMAEGINPILSSEIG